MSLCRSVYVGEMGSRPAIAKRTRTSATEDAKPLPAIEPKGKVYADTLPPRSLTTLVISER